MSPTPSEGARELLLTHSHGVLSTQSLDCAGYPFGSIVPYVLDQAGKLIILISRLAQHTKNIAADPRVSLLVSDADQVDFADIQTCGRVTLIGNAEPVPDGAAQERYLRFFPDARSYVQELDFDFYRLEPLKVRFIGGFGQIHWVPVADLCQPNPFENDAEKDIVEHMNSDHADAVQRCCEMAGIAVPAELTPQMAGVDACGFQVRVGQKIIRCSFGQPATTANDVRKALIRALHS